MFWTRVASSVVLVILIVGIFFAGPMVTGIAMCAVSLIGINELLKVYKLDKSILGFFAYCVNVIYYGLLIFVEGDHTVLCVTVYLLFLLSAYVLTYPKFKDFDMMGAFLPFIYVGIMLSYIYRIRALENGIVLVYLVFVSSWVNDVFAYLVGRTIGKHKLSPILSPKKSIEGFFGGIAGAALFGCIFGAVFDKFVAATDLAILKFAVIGAVGAIPAVIGDLAASAIKRNHDIKDYGKLIPGHGGIMDRFDSAIFTAPIVYYLLTLVWGF